MAEDEPQSIGRWPLWSLFKPPSWDGGSTALAPNSARDVVREIFAAVTGLTTLGPKGGLVWRGQADVEWRIDSKLARKASDQPLDVWQAHESEMLKAARRLGADGSQHNSDLELLGRLRHHGAATRLIDFSQDPMVALWFACTKDDFPGTDHHDGVLAVLNRGSVREVDDPWAFKYERLKQEDDVIYLASLPALDPRITAQRGLFLFAARPRLEAEDALTELGQNRPRGWELAKLTKVCSPTEWASLRGRPVEKFPDIIGILIPAVVKPMVREILERGYGFTRTSMYPDFPGLALSYGEVGTSRLA